MPGAAVDDDRVDVAVASQLPHDALAHQRRLVGQDRQSATTRCPRASSSSRMRAPARVGLGRARVAHGEDGARHALRAVRMVLVRTHADTARRARLDLRGARRAAALADVLVLLAVEQHEEEPLADGHRLTAARTVEQARLERAERLSLLAAARRTTQHALGWLAPSRWAPQPSPAVGCLAPHGRYEVGAPMPDRLRRDLRLPDERGRHRADARASLAGHGYDARRRAGRGRRHPAQHVRHPRARRGSACSAVSASWRATRRARPGVRSASRAAWRSTCATRLRGAGAGRRPGRRPRRLPRPAGAARQARDEPTRRHSASIRDETYADLPVARAAGVRAWVTHHARLRPVLHVLHRALRARARAEPARARRSSTQVRAARRRAASREVVFLGQTVNAYRDDDWDFAELLRARRRRPRHRARSASRRRIPADMSERTVIDAMAECEAIAPQLHLPVQSGSDRVLARMERDYTVEQYEDLVARLRARSAARRHSRGAIRVTGGSSTRSSETRSRWCSRRWSDALRVAVEAQRELLVEPWPFSPPPRVRMALHVLRGRSPIGR